MTSSSKLKSAGIWQTTEVIILVVVQLGYFMIMARLLDKSDFGLMAIANSIVVFGNIFAESGMGSAIIQKKNLTHNHVNAALQGSVITGLLLFVIVYILAPLISDFFEMKALESLIRVISINFFVLSISSVSLGLLHKNFLFKQSSIITIISVVASYSIGISLAFHGYGVWSLVVASILFSIFKMVGYFIYAPVVLKFQLYLREWKELFSFGFGMVLLKVNNYLAGNGLNLFLGKILSIDLLGVFERTYHIKTLPSGYLGGIIDRIMFPTMSEIQDEFERLFKVFHNSLGLVNSIFFPFTLYLIVFSEEIVYIIMGDGWNEAIVPLMIMFVVLPFSSSSKMADSVLRAKGIVYRNAWRKFIYVSILITLTSFGAYNFGIVGAAIGVTVSYIFNYIFMLLLVRHVFEKSINEIIFQPILQGLKLMLILCIIMIGLKYPLSLIINNSIAIFLITSLFISLICIVMYKYNKDIFGEYICVLFDKVFKK